MASEIKSATNIRLAFCLECSAVAYLYKVKSDSVEYPGALSELSLKDEGALMGITQQRGLEAETAILNRLVQLGYEVLHPIGGQVKGKRG